MSPSKVPRTYRKSRRILTQQDQEEETAIENDAEKREAFRSKIALLANIQVSIQGGSIISKTYPLLYSASPVQLTLARFQTLDSLERVTLRYNLHLHYFGSALLNAIGRQLGHQLQECKKLQRISLSELKAALGCQFFTSELTNRSQGIVSILMKWAEIPSNQSIVLSQRRKEFLSLLNKVNWAQVANPTLLQMMRSTSLTPVISKNMDLLQKIKDQLSKRAEASCIANQNRAFKQYRKPLKEEELKTEQARLAEDQVSKDLRASSYQEVPSSALLSFNKSMNASGVDANQESIILPQVGMPEGIASLQSFTKQMKLAEIIENSREKDTSDDMKKQVEKSSGNVTLSSRQNFNSSKSDFLEPPSQQSDLLRKKKSTGRVTSAFLHRQRSSGGYSRGSSQFSPKTNNVSFIMDELKKRDEEIANLKMELLEVKKIQSEQVFKNIRPQSANSSQIEARILNYGDLENFSRASGQEGHQLNQNALNFVTFQANTRESDISRINSASQLTTDGVSSQPNKFNFPWSIFTNANRRSNQSLHSAHSGNHHNEFRAVSPFQPFTQSTFAERALGKTPTRLIKIQDLKENLPNVSECYETPARPLQPPPSAVNTTLRPQVKYLPNRSTSVRTNRNSNQIEPLLVNPIRETSPHQLITSVKMTNSERLQQSVSSFVKSPAEDFYRGDYLKKRYQDVVGHSEFSQSPAYNYSQISRTDTPQFQYQSVRNKH